MPVQKCQREGKPGYKWGEEGKCYIYTPNNEEEREQAKQKAINQGIAMGEIEVDYEGGDSKEMKRVQRYEEAEVLDYVEDEDDGFLTVDIAATRTGVMPYYDTMTGEIINELKPPEEIFSDMTMNSLKGVPVTDRHPPVMVDSNNWMDFTKGTTHQDVRQEDSLLVISETVFDDNLIAYVKSGKKAQVSIGFRADLEEESGEFDGEEYDRIQRNIKINHVAHVEQGRAGENVKARIDSKDGKKRKIGYSLDLNKKEDKKDMDYIKAEGLFDKLDLEEKPDFDMYIGDKMEENFTEWVDNFDLPVKEVEVEKEDEVELVEVEIGDETFKVAEEDAEDIKKKFDSKEGKIDSKEDELETLRNRVDELEDKDVEKIVQKRLNLIDTVREYIDGYDAKEKSSKEIKADLIKKLDEDFELEDKSDEYIEARFDGTIQALNKIKNDSYGENNLMTKKNSKKKNKKLDDKRNERKNLKRNK